MKTTIAGALSLLLMANVMQFAQAFTHPGVLINKADLDRMKNSTNVQPYKTAWASFQSDAHSSSTYTPHPVANETYGQGQFQIRDDSLAAWYNAIEFYVTGNTAFRDKSKSIIDAWTGTLKTFDVTDHLSAGPAATNFSAAAEILRYENGGMTSTEITDLQNMLINLLYPALLTPGGSIAANHLEAANHGSTQILGLICMGVFCNRTDIYNFAVSSAELNTGTNAPYSIPQYIDPSGQNYESQRDQAHSSYGVDNLIVTAECAYKQGTNMFSLFNNRLMVGGEMLAKFNLWNDVRPVTWTAVDGSVHSDINPGARGDRGEVNEDILMRHYSGMTYGPRYANTYFPNEDNDYNSFIYRVDSSGVVPAREAVPAVETQCAVFGNGDFGGWIGYLGVGSYTTAQMQSAGANNNGASSVKLPAGWTATLYDGDNFTGNSVVITGNAHNLGDFSFNDATSSIKVASTGGLKGGNCIFYDGENYTGNSVGRGAGNYDVNNMGLANDSMSSFKIPAGYFVTLYSNGSFTGNQAYYLGSESTGIKSFGVSSFRVEGSAQ